MAASKEEADNLESWLEGLGSLREKLLEQGLKTKEELLWLSQEEIDQLCQENNVPLFEKKRLEMKLLALQALTKGKSPSPNMSVSNTRKSRSKHHAHSFVSSSALKQAEAHNNNIPSSISAAHKRGDSSYSVTKGGVDKNDEDLLMLSEYANATPRGRQPTIVRIVFSEAEESKLITIKEKSDQIMHNMSALNWERDRLGKYIDKVFDEFVLHLQRRRNDVKSELNQITEKQMKKMRSYIHALNKQTKCIQDAQKKCEKHLSNTKLSKSSRKSKVLQAANKALNDRTDEKIIVPEIHEKKKKNKENHHSKEKIAHDIKKTYFVTLQLDESQQIEGIGEIRRVLVPYPPKFEIFVIEATRIKVSLSMSILKVWDQSSSNSKLGKKERIEFMAMIAEQPSKYVVSSSDEYDEMQENSTIIEENPNESNHRKVQQPNGHQIIPQQPVVQQPGIGEHDIDYDVAPDQPPNDDNDDEKKEDPVTVNEAQQHNEQQNEEEEEEDEEDDDSEEDLSDEDDAEITTKKTAQDMPANDDVVHDDEDEENKYNANSQPQSNHLPRQHHHAHNDEDIITNGVRTDSSPMMEAKKANSKRHRDRDRYRTRERHQSSSSSHRHHRQSRHHDRERKKRRKHKHRKIDWTQYPVFKPHDYNDRKVMSNKYTIWIDNLKPNTAYFLKLRGCNKYGKGDWTNLYSFVTKLTAFEFKSCVVKDAEMKNAVFEILNKNLRFPQSSRRRLNTDTHQFALKRLFSSDSQGFSAAKFHETCDNKQRTLVIAESEYGNIFGGYTDLSWSSSPQDKWKNDKNAFLFLLRNEQRKLVNMVFDCVDQYNATRSNINSGPCFGAGLDLYIADNCNKSDSSYSTPKSYNIPPNVLLGGKKNFRIKNYDVYMIV